MAVKREKPEPLLEDVILCSTLGWTYQELIGQPAKFVEKMKIYLNILDTKKAREQEQLREEFERMRSGW